MNVLVIDASIAGAWVLPDEQNALARQIRLGLATSELVVPAHWWFEVANLLLMAERRARIDAAGTRVAISLLASLPISIDHAADRSHLLELSRKHGLTAYDSAYLELAERRSLPLATLDGKLARAAGARALRATDD